MTSPRIEPIAAGDGLLWSVMIPTFNCGRYLADASQRARPGPRPRPHAYRGGRPRLHGRRSSGGGGRGRGGPCCILAEGVERGPHRELQHLYLAQRGRARSYPARRRLRGRRILSDHRADGGGEPGRRTLRDAAFPCRRGVGRVVAGCVACKTAACNRAAPADGVKQVERLLRPSIGARAWRRLVLARDIPHAAARKTRRALAVRLDKQGRRPV
jgi:hypothetical protein